MDYFSLAEAAEKVGVSTKQMRNLIEAGRAPCSKISGRLRVEKEELAKFLASCRIVSAEEAANSRFITVRERRLQAEKERRAQAENIAPEEGARAA